MDISSIQQQLDAVKKMVPLAIWASPRMAKEKTTEHKRLAGKCDIGFVKCGKSQYRDRVQWIFSDFDIPYNGLLFPYRTIGGYFPVYGPFIW